VSWTTSSTVGSSNAYGCCSMHNSFSYIPVHAFNFDGAFGRSTERACSHYILSSRSPSHSLPCRGSGACTLVVLIVHVGRSLSRAQSLDRLHKLHIPELLAIFPSPDPEETTQRMSYMCRSTHMAYRAAIYILACDFLVCFFVLYQTHPVTTTLIQRPLIN
jgi:hypothetical protein